MVICRTPFRVSFFGGGTDYPCWYLKHGGQVLASTINKYCYLTCRYLPPFFEHRLRVVYSRVENKFTYDEVEHPAIRETLRFLNCPRGLEIHHDGDLPARSGMGSSSSFIVGFLHAMYALQGQMPSKQQLARESIHIEQEMIRETVGSQDQISAAFGGLNRIIFSKTGEFSVHPLTLPLDRIQELSSHLMLFYTSIKRSATDVAKSYTPTLDSREPLLKAMSEMVDRAVDILSGPGCICKFGGLLHESWMLKRQLSDLVSNSHLDEMYSKAMANGAVGGKLLGAGGGGFLLLFVPPTAQKRVREVLREFILVPFQFENAGSQIIFYDPRSEDYSHLDEDRKSRDLKCFSELSLAPKATGC